MCFLRSLLKLHTLEIGLKLFHSALLRDLWIGETLLIVHLDRKVPVVILRLRNVMIILELRFLQV